MRFSDLSTLAVTTILQPAIIFQYYSIPTYFSSTVSYWESFLTEEEPHLTGSRLLFPKDQGVWALAIHKLTAWMNLLGKSMLWG